MIIVFVFKMDEQFKIARYIKFVVQPFRKVYGGWKCIKCSALVLNFCFGRGPSQANLLILQFLYLAWKIARRNLPPPVYFLFHWLVCPDISSPCSDKLEFPSDWSSSQLFLRVTQLNKSKDKEVRISSFFIWGENQLNPR